MYLLGRNNFKTSTKKASMTLHSFCIQFPNVAFFIELEVRTSFHLPSRKYENVNSVIIVTKVAVWGVPS